MLPSLATATHNHKLFSLLHQQRDIATTTSRYLLVAILSMASSTAPSASVLLALLKEKGFDPDEMNKACRVTDGGLQTPMNYYSFSGNITMCRYLLSCDADGRTTNSNGWSPMMCAAQNGQLEIMKLLSQVGGAHEDIRKVITRDNVVYSPLFMALATFFNIEVVYWLIRKGALSSPSDDVDGGGMDDAIMRRDLRQFSTWRNEDRRLAILVWARDVVTTHDTVKLLLITGTIMLTSLYRRHPNNPCATRSNKRRKKSSSPLVMLKGKSGILELIAHYVSGTKQQIRTLRQLIERLPAFIADVPFIVVDEHIYY